MSAPTFLNTSLRIAAALLAIGGAFVVAGGIVGLGMRLFLILSGANHACV